MQGKVVDEKVSNHYHHTWAGGGGSLTLSSFLLLFLPQSCSRLATGSLFGQSRRSLRSRIPNPACVAGVVRQLPSIFLGSLNRTLRGGAGAVTNWHTPRLQSTPRAQNRGSILILLRHHFRNQPIHRHVINVMLLCACVGLELVNFPH